VAQADESWPLHPTKRQCDHAVRKSCTTRRADGCVGCSVGFGLRPSAQSGRGSSGYWVEVVREDDDVGDCVRMLSYMPSDLDGAPQSRGGKSAGCNSTGGAPVVGGPPLRADGCIGWSIGFGLRLSAQSGRGSSGYWVEVVREDDVGDMLAHTPPDPDGAPQSRGGKSAGCNNTGAPVVWLRGPTLCTDVRVGWSVGFGLRPMAQSGRGGSGCWVEVVREVDDVDGCA
jgi:hypothetical protein